MCYYSREVSKMEQDKEKVQPAQEEILDAPEGETAYEPRPWWQVWGARVAVVIFIIILLLSYINIARGGM